MPKKEGFRSSEASLFFVRGVKNGGIATILSPKIFFGGRVGGKTGENEVAELCSILVIVSENGLHNCSTFFPHSFRKTGIDLKRYNNVFMSHPLLQIFRFNTLFGKQSCMSNTQGMHIKFGYSKLQMDDT